MTTMIILLVSFAVGVAIGRRFALANQQINNLITRFNTEHPLP